jgi:hypothetical protein
MNTISDVILFYSEFSKESIQCINFINQSKIPINLIALDSYEAREFAKNGSNIQIKNVPSLLVSFSNGDIQLFVGRPKIIEWIQNIINKKVLHKSEEFQAKNNYNSHNVLIKTQDQKNITSPFGRSSRSDASYDGEERRVHNSSTHNNSSHVTRGVIKTEKYNDEKRKKNKKSRRISPKNVDNPVELIIEDGPRSNKPFDTSLLGGLSTKTDTTASKNSNLMELAKKMMNDRENTLGYNIATEPK